MFRTVYIVVSVNHTPYSSFSSPHILLGVATRVVSRGGSAASPHTEHTRMQTDIHDSSAMPAIPVL